MKLWLYLGTRFLRDETTSRLPSRTIRVIRQSIVVTVFVIFIFTLTAMNVSFDMTFHRTQQALQTSEGVILHDNGTISFGIPPNEWVWNASQAAVDNATLMLWSKAKGAFDAVTWASAIMLIAREASLNYSEAKTGK